MNSQKLLNDLLTNLLNEIENIEMIAVVDREGLPIASLLRSEEEDVISAVTASFDSFIGRIKKEFKGENFFNIMELGDRKFCFKYCSNNAILTFVGSKDVRSSQLRVFGDFASEKVAKIINQEEINNVNIPSILKIISNYREGKLPKGLFTAKIIVCGDYSVGKTSLIRRFVDDMFKEDYYSTIGVDITKKVVKLSENTEISFLIWDIGGQMRHMTTYRQRFYTGANAAIVVFDKTRKDSFDGIEAWLKDISKEVKDEIPKVLVANKIDLIDEFQVTTEEIEVRAKELNMEYIETSAKTGENVEDAFIFLAYKSIS